jgi:alpha-galactosidase
LTICIYISQSKDAKSRWFYRAVPSLGAALKDADFVIISILPGTLKEMESDVHAPEKFGVYQSVGDTVGPGGIIRALRTFPIYKGFAEAIR